MFKTILLLLPVFTADFTMSFSPDIPSPTRKKGSTSTSEDCVVPDIDDEDNVFNFEQPRVPTGKEEN